MKIIFAADMSVNYFETFAGQEKADVTMAEATGLFAKADFSMINLENILGNKDDGGPIIKSGPNMISDDAFIGYVHALKPTIVGLANNHSKDYGENILLHSIDMLRNSGYICIGAGKDIEEAYQPAKISKDGIDVAIIAVCENEFGIATKQVPGTAGFSLGRVTKAIKQALHEGCKPIIYFHGGNERNPFPSPGKVELYHHFIDLGAEAVIAMHTHCPQGYEYYEGKPIVYSMGNFFFPKPIKQMKSWSYGYMSELNITESDVTLEIHPYTFDFDKLTLLKDADKAWFMEYMEHLCQPLQKEEELQNLFDSWCLTQGYVDTLSGYRAELLGDGHAEEIKRLKNVFGCEAHNELVKNTLLMIYESRVERARTGVELIEKLQNMKWEEK